MGAHPLNASVPFVLMMRITMPLIVALTAAAPISKAQEVTDSLAWQKSDTLRAHAIRFGQFRPLEEDDRVVNTSFLVHDYQPWLRNSPVRNDLGNLGSADHPVLFAFDRPFGFAYTGSRSLYFQRIEERQMLFSEKGHSNVSYVNGQRRENQLQADLARALGNMLHAGISFRRVSSEGFLSNHRNLMVDFSLFAAFRSRDERYRAHFIFAWQDLDNQENGGLANDTAFEAGQLGDLSFLPTRLSQAFNRRMGWQVGLEHRYSLIKLWLNDSTRYSKRFLPAISHSFSAERHSHVYRDVPGAMYERIYIDSIVTKDSTNVLSVKNELRLNLVTNDSVKGGVLRTLYAGAGHGYHQVHFDSIHHALNNLWLSAGADGTLLKAITWRANYRFMLAGHNALDNRVDGGIALRFGKWRAEAEAIYHLFRPDFITERYESNHFRWDNAFGKTNHLAIGGNLRQERLRFRADVHYHLLQNLVVFGTDRLPYQSSNVNQVVVIRAREHVQVRWFHLMVDGAVQLVLSGDELRIPTALGRAILFYRNSIFKKRLGLTIGAEVSYASAYRANAYNPALSHFYLQDQRMVGNYPFMDFFLNMRIKSFQGFFKIEHWNAGLMGNRYYLAPGYPNHSLAWKFGVRWAFLD